MRHHGAVSRGWGASAASTRLIRLFYATDSRLTVALVAMTVARGLFFPLLTLASGVLVGALRDGRPVTVPLTIVIGAFAGRRILDPLLAQVSALLTRRVDEELITRTMREMIAPVGMAHLEDPELRDRVTQAQGAVTAVSPGEAATRLPTVWVDWIQGALALAIVAHSYPLLAIALLASYLIAYRIARKHWHEVTLVLYHRTDDLRRSYYLRTLALTGDAAKEIRVFGLGSWLVQEYRSGWLTVMRSVWGERDEAWLTMLGATLLVSLVEAGTLILLAHDAASRAVSLALAVATAQAIIGASRLSIYHEHHWVMGEAVHALDMIDSLHETPIVGGVEAGGAHDATGKPTRSLRFENVHFTYPGAVTPVFSGLDLEVKAGSSLAIVGQNGAGKTTLIKLLTRLYDPTDGRITVDGNDLCDLDVASWRRQIAAVFQDHVQFELTARDNVAFGRSDLDWTDADLDRVAVSAGAQHLIARLSHGWDTVLSREYSDGTQLSGGEWQRLALARAMLAVHAGAGVLVLDEPTSAMDVRGEAEIYDRFLELTRGLTTIVVSHRFSTVRRADRIVVIEHGRLLEDGDHDALMALDGRYAHMYRLQAARFQDHRP